MINLVRRMDAAFLLFGLLTIGLAALLFALVWQSSRDDDEAEPTRMPALTASATTSITPSATVTLTWTPAATNTQTPTRFPTNTATSTPTATDTATFTPSPTKTATYTPTATETASPTDTASPTLTPSLTPTATNTVTDVPTSTPEGSQLTITSEDPLILSGNAPLNTAVSIFEDGAYLNSANPNDAGEWSAVLPATLSAGDHTLSVIAADSEGNITNLGEIEISIERTSDPTEVSVLLTATVDQNLLPVTSTPTNTATQRPTAEPTEEASPTIEQLVVEVTETLLPTEEASLPPTLTPTASETATLLPSETPTSIPSPTDEPSSTPTETLEPTVTASNTPTDEPTLTSTATATETASPTETTEPTEIAQLVDPTATSTETSEPTATSTATEAEVPTSEPTEAAQLVDPTATSTETSEPTATASLTPTDEPTATSTATATETASPTATLTHTATPSETATVTPSATATDTSTPTPTATRTSTATPIVPPRITSPRNGQTLIPGAVLIEGTAPAGTTIVIRSEDQILEQTTVSESGDWSVSITLPEIGRATLEAAVIDDQGNTLAVSDPLRLVIAESIAPATGGEIGENSNHIYTALLALLFTGIGVFLILVGWTLYHRKPL